MPETCAVGRKSTAATFSPLVMLPSRFTVADHGSQWSEPSARTASTRFLAAWPTNYISTSVKQVAGHASEERLFNVLSSRLDRRLQLPAALKCEVGNESTIICHRRSCPTVRDSRIPFVYLSKYRAV